MPLENAFVFVAGSGRFNPEGNMTGVMADRYDTMRGIFGMGLKCSGNRIHMLEGAFIIFNEFLEKLVLPTYCVVCLVNL